MDNLDSVQPSGLDVSASDWKILQDLLARLSPEIQVLAHGSRVKGTARKFSDLDIILKSVKPLAESEFASLREAFQNSALPFKVDIADWAQIPESLQKNILERHYRIR